MHPRGMSLAATTAPPPAPRTVHATGFPWLAAMLAIGLLAAALPRFASAATASPRSAARAQATPKAAPPGPLSPDGVPERLVLALDGIPYDLFAQAQKAGLFQGFRPAGRMVSTFPSLSDVAFATVSGARRPAGYQVMRFDRAQNRVVGTTMKALGSESHDTLPLDSRGYTSGHRAWSYMASYHAALREMRDVGDDLLASPRETFVGYVEASDAMMHVHGAACGRRFLVQLDSFLTSLSAEVRRRTGRDLLVDLVSDHGSTLVAGRPIRISHDLQSCGLRRRKQLDDDKSVAYSLAGIIASVAFACEPSERERLAHCLLDDPGVDLVTLPREDRVAVLGTGGEAEITPTDAQETGYAYRMLKGDPLGLGPLAGVQPDAPRPAEVVLRQDEWFARTTESPYPDAPRRIWRAFHGVVDDPADVLVSLRDGYEAGNGGVRVMAKLRGRAGTHGSLTRNASLGVLASNWRDVPDVDAWSARDTLFGEATRSAAAARSGAAPASATRVSE